MNVRSDRWHRRVARAQFAAYVLIVVVSAIGFYRLERGQEVDQQERIDRCDNAQANRDALLDVVDEIELLGRDLVVGAEDASAPTPQQQAALDRFRTFERDLRGRIDVAVCDEDGRPTSPPPEEAQR